MTVALSIPISDDEMAIVYHSGVGGCIDAMTNEHHGVPGTPLLPEKQISPCSGGCPLGFDIANPLLIHYGGAAIPFSLTAIMVKEGGGLPSVTRVTPESLVLCQLQASLI